ncbi:MAG: hypothetical protein U9P73_01205 [Candidatus Cloacimonadota bacterium]|nr:hypothetical protein [Candidatus Cloacimonadota bacterium]
METSKVQAIIGILLVVAFIIVTSIIALTPVLGAAPAGEYTEHLKTFVSVYTGIIGLIVGFYFGKK